MVDKIRQNYDAIVIGSGISGGWAAKELCERGLKTLVLERGKNVRHLLDYPTAMDNPWDAKYRQRIGLEENERNEIVSRCVVYRDDTKHFFTDDDVQPYIQERPFDWIRGYQVGGKSLIWGRQTQRWSKYDFEGAEKDGMSPDWPIRYDDLAPWYTHVERFVGISGNRDGLRVLPDGDFLKPWAFNHVEKVFRDRIKDSYQDRRVIMGRCANLTEKRDLFAQQGRGQCQARRLCQRGCPFGGYFSSISATLPWAEKTGNLTVRPNNVVHSIIYDDKQGKATGVRVIDDETKDERIYHARVIFVNASTLNTNLILLNSKSPRFPEGLGNDSGLMGSHIIFHNYRGSIRASFEGYLEKYYYGKRPTQPIIPNFRNVEKQEMDFYRGYMSILNAYRQGWSSMGAMAGIGADFKDRITEPGPWNMEMSIQGETIPKASNRVTLDKDRTDDWGMPLLNISVDYDENDEKMLKDFFDQGCEMLDVAGFQDIQIRDNKQAPGLDIHEMGGLRMGIDSASSVLNKFNQLHSCKNVFVTDGACMNSTGTQNPSLTFMALTARAVDYAVGELDRHNI